MKNIYIDSFNNLYEEFLYDFYENQKRMIYMFESKFRYSLCEHYRYNLSFKNKWFEHMKYIYDTRNDYSFLNRINRTQRKILEYFFLDNSLNEINLIEIEQEWNSINLKISLKEILIIHFLLRDDFYIKDSKLYQTPVTRSRVKESLKYLSIFELEDIKEKIVLLIQDCFYNDPQHIKHLKLILRMI